MPFETIVGRYVARDTINEETGLIWAEAGDELTWDIDARSGDVTGGTLKVLLDNGVTEIQTLDVDNINVGAYIRNTMAVDKNMNRDQALMDIYRDAAPRAADRRGVADVMFQSLFFDPERYDLSAVGRVKMNMRLDLDAPDTMRTLRTRTSSPAYVRSSTCATARDRRHRPPRQPPGALGRRADGEPVPRRPAAHGAGDPRAHELGRDRHGDAAGSDQRQTGGGGWARVLRLVAAQPVHGPDQPAQ